MILIGQGILKGVGRKNAPLCKALAGWATAVENVQWKCLEDVRRTYPSADGVKLKSKAVVTVFNIKGNDYRLLSVIDCDGQLVEVLEVLTHPEYDKNPWKGRY
jgi:mRNA interferase HigB